MKNKSLQMFACAGLLTAFLAIDASAGPADPSTDPQRVEPHQKHEAASSTQPQAEKPAREPRRIFDITKGEFVPNPEYHDPVH